MLTDLAIGVAVLCALGWLFGRLGRGPLPRGGVNPPPPVRLPRPSSPNPPPPDYAFIGFDGQTRGTKSVPPEPPVNPPKAARELDVCPTCGQQRACPVCGEPVGPTRAEIDAFLAAAGVDDLPPGRPGGVIWLDEPIPEPK